MTEGKIYLIPVSLGDHPEQKSTVNSVPMAAGELNVLNKITEFIVENEKTARRCLKELGYALPLKDVVFHPLNQHTPPEEILTYLSATEKGNDMGLLSEAGCPGIADPGAVIVRMAHEKNIRVVPLVGPSSLLLSLMASGMNGQNFCFNGYLPKDQKERIHKLKELERLALKNNQTQLFIETPYRNNHLIEDVCSHLHPETLFCIACDLTLPGEFIKTQAVGEWKKRKPDIHKRPAVFLIGK